MNRLYIDTDDIRRQLVNPRGQAFICGYTDVGALGIVNVIVCKT